MASSVDFDALCSFRPHIRHNYIRNFEISKKTQTLIDTLNKCLYSPTKCIGLGLVEFIIHLVAVKKTLDSQELIQILKMDVNNRTNLEKNCFLQKKLLIIASVLEEFQSMADPKSNELCKTMILNFIEILNLDLISMRNFLPLIYEIIVKYSKIFLFFKSEHYFDILSHFDQSQCDTYAIFLAFNWIYSTSNKKNLSLKDKSLIEIDDLSPIVKFFKLQSSKSKICSNIINQLLIHFIILENIEAIDMLHEICYPKFYNPYITSFIKIVMRPNEYFLQFDDEKQEDLMRCIFSCQYFPNILYACEKQGLLLMPDLSFQHFLSNFANYHTSTQLSLLVNICDPAILKDHKSSMQCELINVSKNETITDLLRSYQTMLILAKKDESDYYDSQCWLKSKKCIVNALKSDADSQSKSEIILLILYNVIFPAKFECPQRIFDQIGFTTEANFDPLYKNDLKQMTLKLLEAIFYHVWQSNVKKTNFLEKFNSLTEIISMTCTKILPIIDHYIQSNCEEKISKSIIIEKYEIFKKTHDDSNQKEKTRFLLLVNDVFLILAFLEIDIDVSHFDEIINLIKNTNNQQFVSDFYKLFVYFIKMESKFFVHFANTIIMKYILNSDKEFHQNLLQSFINFLINDLTAIHDSYETDIHNNEESSLLSNSHEQIMEDSETIIDYPKQKDDNDEDAFENLEILSKMVIKSKVESSKAKKQKIDHELNIHCESLNLEKLLIKILSLTDQHTKLKVFCQLTTNSIENKWECIKFINEIEIDKKNHLFLDPIPSKMQIQQIIVESCDFIYTTITGLLDLFVDDDIEINKKNNQHNYMMIFYKLAKYFTTSEDLKLSSTYIHHLNEIKNKFSNYLRNPKSIFVNKRNKIISLFGFIAERRFFFQFFDESIVKSNQSLSFIQDEQKSLPKISHNASDEILKFLRSLINFYSNDQNDEISSKVQRHFIIQMLHYVSLVIILGPNDKSAQTLNNLANACFSAILKFESFMKSDGIKDKFQFLHINKKILMRCSKPTKKIWSKVLQYI